MSFEEFSGATVDDAITAATVKLGVTSDCLEYEVVEKGSSGFLGLGGKDALIRARVKNEDEAENTDNSTVENLSDQKMEAVQTEAPVSVSEEAVEAESEKVLPENNNVDIDAAKELASDFLNDVFAAMQLEVNINYEFDKENNTLCIELSGPEMGIIIGKRGQTLDSVQYLTNLAVNRKLDSYVRIKIDTEDYRRRRKETLENLAKNVAYKVKRTRKPVSLEAMNPYERRIIHYALQGDNYVTTHSEGEEPYRHVVVTLK